MKILHYIPQQVMTAPVNQEFIVALQSCLGRYEKVITVHSMKSFKQILRDETPDIIHFFGCWNLTAFKVQQTALHRNLPVVLSPLSGLMPWNIRHHYLSKKYPSLVAYQQKAVLQADAIHVWSALEQEQMRKKKWDERMQLIRNSTITNDFSDEQMATQMVQLYQKVIDSNTFRLMTDRDRQAETLLLRKGLAHDEYSGRLSADDLELLQSLSEDSWRKILIHAADEDIMPFVRQGAEELQLAGINTRTDSVKRFPQKIRKPKGELTTTELISKNPITKTIIDNLRVDEKPSPLEMEICMLIHNLNHTLTYSKGIAAHSSGTHSKSRMPATLSRRHLVQLYTLLRFNDYDEDKLSRMLKRLKLDRFTSRLLCILDESFVMGEGFSPLPLTDDKTTARLRQTLTELHIQ